MNNKPHCIGSILFETEYPSVSNALVFRQEFTELVKHSLLSVVEEVLNELNPNDSILRLDLVEIQLPPITYPFDEWNIKNQLWKCLKDELNFRIVGIRHQLRTTIQPEGLILSTKSTDEELLLFFIQYGTLPWWAAEHKMYSISIEAIIETLSESEPGILYRILNKIRNSPTSISRFVSHCPEAALMRLVDRNSSMNLSEIKEMEYYFQQSYIVKKIPQFEKAFKEFIVLIVVLEKRQFTSAIYFQTSFIHYLLQQNYVYGYQLSDLFPEYTFFSWLRFHFPEEFMRLHSYWKPIQTLDVSLKKTMFSFLRMTLLKRHKSGQNDIILTLQKELEKMLKGKSLVELEPMSYSAKAIEVSSPKKSERYFDSIGNKIIQYLLYGILSWEDRPVGIPGIEALILQFHEENPEKFKKLIASVKSNYYPVVLARVEENFTKDTADIFLKFYFSKEVALNKITTSVYKDKILKTFFKKGIVPWEEIIGNTIQETESIILAFYNQDPAYFVRSLKAFFKPNTEFKERIETLYSQNFNFFLKGIISNEIPDWEVLQSNKVPLEKLVLPEDIDLIVYFLHYYEQHRILPSEIEFSVSELVDYFVKRFPKQARLYFTVAAYNNSDILKQQFSTESMTKIAEWMKTDHLEKVQSEGKKLKLKKYSMNEEITQEIKEPIYLANAGLVLIHPFLQRCFSLCGLLEKGKFKNIECAHKAIHLLHFIVFKTQQPEEHRLVLNKILCGIPLIETIDRSIELSDEEMEICESLIRGVIQNWPQLKNTSNENFRVSFLQREGKLMVEEKSFRLKVEERGFDVLLDMRPWAISMIKLPWMENLLHVDWR